MLLKYKTNTDQDIYLFEVHCILKINKTLLISKNNLETLKHDQSKINFRKSPTNCLKFIVELWNCCLLLLVSKPELISELHIKHLKLQLVAARCL